VEERTEETRDAQTASVGEQELTDKEVVSSVLDWMQKTLGVNRTGRLADNDWTFIVKLHAMVETALNAALVNHFNAPELDRIVAKLDTSNLATGKVAFAKALKIILPSSVGFIQKLSELRNFCVHDIRNFEFQLDKHLENLTESKRRELVSTVMKAVNQKDRNSTSLREALRIGVMGVMMELAIHDRDCQIRALTAELHRRTYEIYEAQKQPKTKEG